MKIAIASDHAGFELKENIKKYLGNRFEMIDCGPHSADAVDYPDLAHKASHKVENKEVERAILICGSGIGMSMAANRHKGVRAAVLHDLFDAEMSRKHNDANVACLGARTLAFDIVKTLLDKWLETPFEGGRHERRVGKIEL